MFFASFSAQNLICSAREPPGAEKVGHHTGQGMAMPARPGADGVTIQACPGRRFPETMRGFLHDAAQPDKSGEPFPGGVAPLFHKVHDLENERPVPVAKGIPNLFVIPGHHLFSIPYRIAEKPLAGSDGPSSLWMRRIREDSFRVMEPVVEAKKKAFPRLAPGKTVPETSLKGLRKFKGYVCYCH